MICRRRFLEKTGCALSGIALTSALATHARSSPPSRPNILLIVTDQQQAESLSCAGNPYVKTPNLDRLAAEGVRFEKAYSANPVCIPSRFSMFTGTMPSVIGMEDNSEEHNAVPPGILAHAMGALFRAAGYHTAYAGKVHLPGQPEVVGNVHAYGFEERFSPKDHEGRARTLTACNDFIRMPHTRPFLLVASLINPHDICYLPLREWVEAQPHPEKNRRLLSPAALQELDAALQPPRGVSEQEFYDRYAPPLPANHPIPENELTAFMAPKHKSYLGWARQNYTERQWRRYRWAYARLTEKVDTEIGALLATVRAAGLEENTVVVFVSDHGEQNGAHRAVTKGMLYEESTRVPLIMRWKGVTQAGRVDTTHLVSTGLDLIPTLCDFAGIRPPPTLKGRSLRPLAEGAADPVWRKYLVVENNRARLVHMGDWKYMVGHADTVTPPVLSALAARRPVREMLVHLSEDPGEMHNRADDPLCRPRIQEGRELLRTWYAEHGFALDAGYEITD